MMKLDSLRKEEPFYGSSKRSSFPRFIYLCVCSKKKRNKRQKKTQTLSFSLSAFSLKRSSSRCSYGNGVVKIKIYVIFFEERKN